MSEPKADSKQPGRKMVHEELLERLHAALGPLLKEFPEVRGLLVAIDWNIGQNDFPASLILSKEVTERTTLEMMRQTVKLLDQISLVFNKQIDRADSVLRQAEQFIQSADKPDTGSS